MKRGWCPSLYDPMPTGDGLLVRVKPPGGLLSSGAARLLAQAALRHGNGIIELTSRANLQIRGLTPSSAPRFAAAMVAAGLASADPGVERRRNVMALPLAGYDPAAAADAGPLAAALEAMLAAEPALAALPAKFGFAVDGGGVLALSDSADITIRTDGARHWIGLGEAEAPCSSNRTIDFVRDLARAAGARHMRELGTSAFTAAGLLPAPRTARLASPLPVGFVAYPHSTTGAFGLGLPFGQADAAAFEAMAGLAERFCGGTLRTSPWRSMLLGQVEARHAPALFDAAAANGLIADSKDRRLQMAACIGSAGCASGTVRARDDAAALASAGWTGFLHVSGCAKGCAHPGDTRHTLVGEGGSYGLVRDGRASGVPCVTGLSVAEAATHLGQHP